MEELLHHLHDEEVDGQGSLVDVAVKLGLLIEVAIITQFGRWFQRSIDVETDKVAGISAGADELGTVVRPC